MKKQILEYERVRRVPSHFSWVDHRLVRHHYIEQAGAASWALYLVLLTVGDEHGLSFYSDKTLSAMLSLDLDVLAAARVQLIRAGVLAYSAPLYQVLALAAEANQP